MKRKLNYLLMIFAVMLSEGLVADPADKEVRVLSILAMRYEYKPAVIKLNRDQPVELHFHSKDVLHGFLIPELNIRADLVPGHTTVVKIPALKQGEYPFLCDIFCGSQHSSMQGKLVVN